MSRQLLKALAVVALLAAPFILSAQSPTISQPVTVPFTSASSTTCGATLSVDAGCTSIDVKNWATAFVEINCTNSPAFTDGTIFIEGDSGAQTWARSLMEQPLIHCGDVSTTANWTYRPFSTVGLTNIRIRLGRAIIGAGTATVTIRAATATDAMTYRSQGRILSQTVLGSGGNFTMPWLQADVDGTIAIEASGVATTIGSAVNGVAAQGADDWTNATNVRTIGVAQTATAAQNFVIVAPVSTRFYRMAYTNGAGTQGAFTYAFRPSATTFVSYDAFAVPIMDLFVNTTPVLPMAAQSAIAAANSVTPSFKSALTTAVNIKTTAGNLYGFYYSGGATTCFIQFLNSTGAGTLGTAIIAQFPIPAITGVIQPPSNIAIGNFSSGIAVGVSSAVNGATACGTAGQIEVFFQ